MTIVTKFNRRRYADGLKPGTAISIWAETWLKVLIAQDGSATRLCEVIAGGPVQLTVSHQCITDQVPFEVLQNLPGERFMERFVSLSVGGEVMMDNLSYISLDAIEPSLCRILEEGQSPIGHLFDRLWVRKKPLDDMQTIHARLWERSGLPDPLAVRSYLVDTPAATCMLISETFRAGMRRGLPGELSE